MGKLKIKEQKLDIKNEYYFKGFYDLSSFCALTPTGLKNDYEGNNGYYLALNKITNQVDLLRISENIDGNFNFEQIFLKNDKKSKQVCARHFVIDKENISGEVNIHNLKYNYFKKLYGNFNSLNNVYNNGFVKVEDIFIDFAKPYNKKFKDATNYVDKIVKNSIFSGDYYKQLKDYFNHHTTSEDINKVNKMFEEVLKFVNHKDFKDIFDAYVNQNKILSENSKEYDLKIKQAKVYTQKLQALVENTDNSLIKSVLAEKLLNNQDIVKNLCNSKKEFLCEVKKTLPTLPTIKVIKNKEKTLCE